MQQQTVKPALMAATVGRHLSVQEDDRVVSPDESRLRDRLKKSETLCNLESLFGHLSKERCAELSVLINNYLCLFNDVPTRTHLIEHDIDVGDAQPIRQRFYRVSEEKRKVMEKEIKYMLDNNIAEPSSSFLPSTFFPLLRIEDCVDQVGSAQFVSKIDLLKGYRQVPLSQRAREISAFITPFGLFSYTVMSFGLRNAPATFQRLMTMVVSGLEGCTVYLDDIVVYSDRNIMSTASGSCLTDWEMRI